MTFQQFIDETHLTCDALKIHSNPLAEPSAWDNTASHWSLKIYIDHDVDTAVIYFSMGSAHKGKPVLADVLECLQSDAWSVQESFADFCGNCGLDEDSRKALKTYDNTRLMIDELRRVLPGKNWETFLNCEPEA